MIDLKKIVEIMALPLTKKKDIIKADPYLKELFAKKMGITVTNAKKAEVDNFFNSLKKEMETTATEKVEKTEPKKQEKPVKEEKAEVVAPEEKPQPKAEVVAPVETAENLVPEEPVKPVENIVQEEPDQPKIDVPESVIRRVITDLYPNINNKRRLIQNDRVLLMAFRLAKKELQRASADEMDEFLCNYAKTKDKFIQQLGVNWTGNKKKVFAKMHSFDELTEEDVKNLLAEELTIEDIESYCYLNLDKFSSSTFAIINKHTQSQTPKQSLEQPQEQASGKNAVMEEKNKKEGLSEGSTPQSEDKESALPQKEEIEKFDKVRRLYEQEKNTLKEETRELKRKHEQEKVQLKLDLNKDNKAKLEKQKEEFTEEKNQLLRNLQTRENKLREEKDILEKESKQNKVIIDDLKKELAQKSSELSKVTAKASNLEKRIEELQKKSQSQIEEISGRIHELQDETEAYKIEQGIYLEGKMAVDELLQSLIQSVSDLENLKVASMLKNSEINSVIKEINSPDMEKEKIYRLLTNIELPTTLKTDENLDLWHIWENLIKEENTIIKNYLQTIIKNVNKTDFLDNLQNIADLKYNLKAREILLQIIYEKGHKAYKFAQK